MQLWSLLLLLLLLYKLCLFSSARVCPKLLKDLLASKELENALGKFPVSKSVCKTCFKTTYLYNYYKMFCLQCLIGPPSGFNLRNIAWHGFFIEGEIPVEYVWLS